MDVGRERARLARHRMLPNNPSMTSLRHRLAEHGFVSNEDYEYPVRCLLAASIEHLRCLNVAGEAGRRKTAFAHALAHALGFEHVLYHEFSELAESPPPVRLPPPADDAEQPGEPPVNELDRIISEACALSEGERTALILDRLHKAPFRQHLRLTEFIKTQLWSYADITLKAHAQNLLLVLVSDEPLYHSLQHLAFNLWVDSGHPPEEPITPATLGLAENARGMLDALHSIFEQLNVNPTAGEYRRVVHDIHVNIHSLAHLKTSIYGWVEGVDRRHLMSDYMHQVFERQWPAITAYLGIDHSSGEGIVLREDDRSR